MDRSWLLSSFLCDQTASEPVELTSLVVETTEQEFKPAPGTDVIDNPPSAETNTETSSSDEDVPLIQQAALEICGVMITRETAQELYLLLQATSSSGCGWANKDRYRWRGESGFGVWLKSRLNERNLLQCGQSETTDIRLTVKMHTFFINISDNSDRINPEREVASPATLARSKLAKYIKRKRVKPINATTHKVAPVPFDLDEL